MNRTYTFKCSSSDCEIEHTIVEAVNPATKTTWVSIDNDEFVPICSRCLNLLRAGQSSPMFGCMSCVALNIKQNRQSNRQRKKKEKQWIKLNKEELN